MPYWDHKKAIGSAGGLFAVPIYPRRFAAAPRGYATFGRCLHCFDVFDISLTFRHGAEAPSGLRPSIQLFLCYIETGKGRGKARACHSLIL